MRRPGKKFQGAATAGSGGGSALGAPTTMASGTIGLGNTTFASKLIYSGSGDTTDRIINLSSTTGTIIMEQTSKGLLKFTSDTTATGAGSKILTLQGSTAGNGEIAAAIVDNSSTNKTLLTKLGTGKRTLSGANSFTGETLVTGGTLELKASGANQALGGTGSISITGGTLLTSTANQINHAATMTLNTSSTAIAAFKTGGTSQTLGALTLSSNSVIDLGSGASVVKFANRSANTWSGTLQVWNWTGNGTISGGTDQLFIGTDATRA